MDTKRPIKRFPTQCTICADPAIYSYFGVVVCGSCKIFFRRTAKERQGVLKCKSDGHCEINANTRRVCSSCRYEKCLTSGMQSELIRPTRLEPNGRRRTMANAAETNSLAIIRSNELSQFPTLNLLQSDQSTLTVDEWNLLSNLSHCYDEYIGLSRCERFMDEQNTLPLKMRFKCSAMIEFIQVSIAETQSLYKHNADFLSLSVKDRSLLLLNTFSYVASISTNFITKKGRLIDSPTYYQTIESITNPFVIPIIKRIVDHLDFDIIIMKLFLVILSFSTINYTTYSNTSPMSLTNIKQILHIQDKYIELLWRYLSYKYDNKQSIKYLSELLRCCFAIHEAIVITHEVQWLTGTFHSLTEQIDQSLILND